MCVEKQCLCLRIRGSPNRTVASIFGKSCASTRNSSRRRKKRQAESDLDTAKACCKSSDKVKISPESALVEDTSGGTCKATLSRSHTPSVVARETLHHRLAQGVYAHARVLQGGGRGQTGVLVSQPATGWGRRLGGSQLSIFLSFSVSHTLSLSLLHAFRPASHIVWLLRIGKLPNAAASIIGRSGLSSTPKCEKAGADNECVS